MIEYLGRYTHRMANSNHRLVSIDNAKVTFRYKDYRDRSKQKEMTLDAIEFLRRFCLHILPQRFVKIRHYGFLSSRRKETELPELLGKGTETNTSAMVQPAASKPLSWQEICRQRMNFDPEVCPCCKTGWMKIIEVLMPRSPPQTVTKWQELK